MFNCFKKRREEKQRRVSLRNKRISKKFFDIVITGMEEYEQQQQKEIAVRRWSHLQKRIKSMNAFKVKK
jgi:hypothetical protein